MKKLIEVEGHESEYRFIGGGFGDSGFRTVEMPYRCMYLVNDLKEILHLINPAHVRSVKDISDKEYGSNKDLYKKYTEATKMLIEDYESKSEYESKRYTQETFIIELIKDNYPDTVEKLQRFYRNKRYNRYNRTVRYLTDRMNYHLKLAGDDYILDSRAELLLMGIST